MKHLCLAPILLMALTTADAQLKYPAARKGDTVDDYHGVKIADPYRWLEDTDSPETAAWVAAENRVTQDYLSKIPARFRFKDRLTTLYNYERYSGFEKAGPGYLFFRNNGLQNQDVLYTAPSLNGAGRVLLDPNTLRADGTAALSGHAPSPDGKLLAYAVADAGSDWSVWRVREIATGRDLSDEIHWSKFADVEWARDGRSFYYQRFPEPQPGQALLAENSFAKLYLHRLGQPQSADTLIYERPDQKRWMFSPFVTDDGRYLFLGVFTGDYGKNLLFYQDLRAARPRTVELISKVEAEYVPLGTHGDALYLRTTAHAPKGRIVAIDLARPQPENWREVVPQKNEALDAARMIEGRLVLSYLKDAASDLQVYGLDGRLLQDVKLPGIGQVQFLPGRPNDAEMFFTFVTFTSPAAIYRLDARTNAASVVRQSKLSFDPSRFETEKVFYASKDGTKIPMSLIHRKGLKRDGSNPTILYAYGGFNVSVLPQFSAWAIAWIEAGGLYAVANLRGGAEYGEEWHVAGKRAKKQNVFDDFIAGAEWLISNRYTSTPKLAIFGGSNGGLLVGAVLNQRPDLFGAAMPAVGVMDMLRFQKFTAGGNWVEEYGSSDNPDDFKVIRAYSPLHNIKPGAHYPPVLITTA
ncbi:MAG TPA: prolyl oligopeptidase family serine peptidase, partial [Bryobacteraceae bacterium]